ncbi:MAG: hypothetical protein AAGF01_25605 [Cyanobacteria bacterium P01_G01_bin.38]
MSKIAISELRPAGTLFFSESETFLDNLTDDALINVVGGSAGGAYVESLPSGILSLENSAFCSAPPNTSFWDFPPSLDD